MKRLLILILIALPFLSKAQWQGASGTWQKNTVANQWRYNAGTNGIFSPYDVFEKIQDGLISGGTATTNGDSLIVSLGVVRINSNNINFVGRTFANIPPSATGLSRILVVYANTSGLLDSIAGAQSNNPVEPTLPANTQRVVIVTVSDAGLGTPTVDLIGYAVKNGGNTFTGLQIFSKNDLIEHRSTTSGRAVKRTYINGNYLGDVGFFIDGRFNISGNFAGTPTPILSSKRLLDIFLSDNRAKFFGTVEGLNPVNAQDFVTKAYGDANYLTRTPDTTIYRTVANSYSLATGHPRLVSGINIKTVNSTSLLGSGDLSLGTVTNVSALTLGTSGTDLSSSVANPTNTPVITLNVPNASATNRGALTSTDWNTFNNKQSTISFGTIGATPNVNGASISGGVITLQPASSTFGGVLTSGTQSIVGDKSLVGNFGIGATAASTTFLNLGAGTTAKSVLRIPNGVAPTTPVSGDEWALTTGLRKQRFDGTQTKDYIFDKVNSVFAGFGAGAIITDNLGNLSVAPAADRTTSTLLTKTANYTITLADFGSNGNLILEVDASGGARTITLPSLANMTGVEVTVIKTDASANAVTIQGAVNINGASTFTLTTQYQTTQITGGSTIYRAY